MPLQSLRTATNVGGLATSHIEIKTINDFLKIVNSGDVHRVELDSILVYRKNLIGSGAQSTIYDDAGIHPQSLPSAAVVKCARFHLSNKKGFPETEDRRVRSRRRTRG